MKPSKLGPVENTMQTGMWQDKETAGDRIRKTFSCSGVKKETKLLHKMARPDSKNDNGNFY